MSNYIPRYGFAGSAEVKELGSWKEQVLTTRDLSAGGCFVKTTAPLRVTHNVTAEGMGVEFIEMEPRDRAILEKWLGEKSSP